METNAKDIIPARATHPGSVLKSELQARGIKQKDFAKVIGMPAPNLSEIVKGKRHITEAIAIKLEQALGIPFQTWMNLQNRYHYVMKRRAELDATETSAAHDEQSLCEHLNLRAIYSYFHITDASASKRLSKLKDCIDIAPATIQTIVTNTVSYFKRSDRLKIDEKNMLTWLMLAWCEASKSTVSNPYTHEGALLAASRIAKAANGGSLTTKHLAEILNDCGIIFRHIPKLDAAPIDAYSTMAGEHPAIIVTYRHNDMDKLAFDILHEIGHILMHFASGKSYISVENDYSSQSAEEKEADEFAKNALIAPAVWKSIMSANAKSLAPHTIVNAIANEAQKHGISATIAVARYKHDTRCYAIRGFRSPKIS